MNNINNSKIRFDSALERFKKAFKIKKDTEVSEKMGIAQSNFSEKKKRLSWPIEKSYISCVENGVNPRYVLYGEQPVELQRHDCRVPLYPWPTKGKTLQWSKPVEHIDLGKVLVKEHWHGTRVVGDSMFPDFKHNEPIFLDDQITETDLVSGDPYGVFIPNYGLQIKKIYFQPDKWIFKSTNNPEDTWDMLSHCWKRNLVQIARIRVHIRFWTGRK